MTVSESKWVNGVPVVGSDCEVVIIGGSAVKVIHCKYIDPEQTFIVGRGIDGTEWTYSPYYYVVTPVKTAEDKLKETTDYIGSYLSYDNLYHGVTPALGWQWANDLVRDIQAGAVPHLEFKE